MSAGTTLSRDAIEAAGAALWRAWEAHVLLDEFPGGAPPCEADGYAVQDALIRASGLAAVGWKIGATNRAAQELLSLPGPLSGRLLAPFCFDSPAELSSGDFAVRALEPEAARAWLANHLPARGAHLCAGDLVTTGTCTPIRRAAPGDLAVADFGAFGEARARFV